MALDEQKNKKIGIFFKNRIRKTGGNPTTVVTIPKIYVDNELVEVGKKYLFEIKQEVSSDE